VMIFTGIVLLRALRMEQEGWTIAYWSAETAATDPLLSWRQRRASLIQHFSADLIASSSDTTARPPVEAIAGQIRWRVFSPEITEGADRLDLRIPHGERGEFYYTIRSRSFLSPSFRWLERHRPTDGEKRHFAPWRTATRAISRTTFP